MNISELREAYVLLREIESLQSTEAKSVLERAILDQIRGFTFQLTATSDRPHHLSLRQVARPVS